ncbi:MAG: hypothetical protein JTT11_07275, partial [Candidatus Brockarchaeota archaeon]|nr:hypothetical protein [Candidatus Brockarchaeota archaeon]
WGYCTNVLAWELWNEVELTDGYDFGAVSVWHDVIAKYMREIDPYGHMVTTSSDPRFGSLDSISFVTVHRYGPESFKDIAGGVQEMVKELSARYGKPVMVTEFGADWRWFGDPYTYKDVEGVEIHEGIWSSIMSGSPSSAFLWWWDSYVHPYDLYYHFKALSEYLEGIDPAKARFDYLRAKLVLSPPEGKGDLADLTVYPGLGWARPEANRFYVGLDGKVGNVSQLSQFVHGRAHPELRNNPTFVVNFPFGGEVVVHVNSVAISGAILEIYDNGSLVKSAALPDLDRKNDASAKEYDEFVKASLLPGTHEIKLDNSGGDWLSVDYVKFTFAMMKGAKARIIGLSNGTLALAWIQNSEHNWWNAVNNVTVEPIGEVEFELSGFVDGEYVVEWWDTYIGTILRREEAEASGGRIRLSVRGLEKDLAFKIYVEHRSPAGQYLTHP